MFFFLFFSLFLKELYTRTEGEQEKKVILQQRSITRWREQISFSFFFLFFFFFFLLRSWGIFHTFGFVFTGDIEFFLHEANLIISS